VRSGALERIRGLRISLADRTEPVTRFAPLDRSELLDRSDRPDRPDRPDPSSRGDRGDSDDLGGRPERSDPPGHGEPGDLLDRGADRPELPDRRDPTGQRAERSEPTERSAAIGAADRGDRIDRGADRPELPDRRDPTGQRAERGEPTERSAAINAADRGDRIDRGADRPEPPDRRDPTGQRAERGEPTERSAAIGAADRGDRIGRGDHADAAPRRSAALSAISLRPAEPRGRTWRDRLAAFGAELARGAEAELPVAADTELGALGALAHRLALPAAARHALVALYSLYLVGEPAVSLARLAHALGDWTEPLGQGELGALAMLRRRGGKVALRGSVTDLLDGVGPRAIRVIGTAAAVPRPGAARLARDGRSDAAIETELAGRLGQIAVIEGSAALALLEARLRDATAVALVPPLTRPLPWPRDAGLVVVAEPAAPAWVAALPALTAA
jgi:hypothetical protein